MVETRLQRTRKEMAFQEDDEFVNPFRNFSQGAPIPQRKIPNPFEMFILRDPQGNVTIKEIEAASQDPGMASFVDEIVALDPQCFLAKLFIKRS